jgi:glutathione synthase/RimK-type ligase-like ATP-grasp enzyme
MIRKAMTPVKTTDTLRSVNEYWTADFGLFCNPESRRVEGFSTAVNRILRQRPKLIPWQWLLEDGAWKERLEETPRFLRLESPGRNWNVEQLMLLRGASIYDEDRQAQWRRMSAQEVTTLSNYPGRILPMRQWFLAWRDLLQELDAWAVRHGLASHWLCPPEDVICMFDKFACQQKLQDAGIAVPPALGKVSGFGELWCLMQSHGAKRVFVKPCHGSSASGVTAIEMGGNQMQAFSTVELEQTDKLRLYNRRCIRTYRGARAVMRLVDTIGPERCLAQVWVPKAGMFGHTFDLRVVVIGGRARHVMMRLGKGPMTNSQLLGGKGDVEMLRKKMGEEAWLRMLKLCEDAMAKCFPRTLYAGLDVLIEPDFQTARILEVNAFGDLLPRVLHEGRDTYTWEVEEAFRRGQI